MQPVRRRLLDWRSGFDGVDLHVLQSLSVRDTARTLQVRGASVYMAKYRISRMLKKEVQKLQNKMF